MNYKILDKIGGERETWIVVSFFLIFVVCISWWFGAGRGYFLRFWNGTVIEAGNVELTVPEGYYIAKKNGNGCLVGDISDYEIPLSISAWKGKQGISKVTERVKGAGGEMHSYTMRGYLVYEFFIRSDIWRKDYGGIVYIFPELHLEFSYTGSLTEMYPLMNKFVRTFKKVQETSPGK